MAAGENDDFAAATGYHTLAAQASRQAIDRMMALIRRERGRGVTEAKLAQLLERNLPDYDAHSRQLLLTLGNDAVPPEDFPPATLAASHQTKPNTLELTVQAMPPELNLFSLVQHQGKQWMLVAAEGNRCTLKAL